MKRSLKTILVLLLALLMALSLTACVSGKKLVGTWSGAWIYEGNTIACGFVLSENKSYAETTLKNGEVSSMNTGRWEVKGNKLILHHSESGITEYTYKGGKLYNNNHEFTKKK